MSSFTKETYNPRTQKWEMAQWLDDYFGPHHYAVRFSDGSSVNPEDMPDGKKLKTRESSPGYLDIALPADIQKMFDDLRVPGAVVTVKPSTVVTWDLNRMLAIGGGGRLRRPNDVW